MTESGQNRAIPGSAIVPDAAARAGRFLRTVADLRPAEQHAAHAISRQSHPAGPHRPDRGEVSDEIRAAAQQSRGATSNYRDATPNRALTDSASGRIDHQFGRRGTMTGRYTLNSEGNRLAGNFPLLPLAEDVRAQQASSRT